MNQDNAIRIAALGDSLTEGYGLARHQALPVILEKLLRAEGLNARVLNYGVSGETAAEGLARLPQALSCNPQAMIIEFGANDSYQGVPVNSLRRSLESMLHTLAERKIKALLVGIKALPEFYPPAYARDFDQVFPDLAAKYSTPLFPDILAPYHPDPLMLLEDGIHPNAKGVEAMAKALLPYVKRII